MAADSSNSSLSIVFTEVLLGYFFAVFAALTIFTHFAQIAGISFQSYTVGVLLIVISLTFAAVIFARKRIKQIGSRDSKTLLLLVAAGVLCALLALFSHRSSVDDFYYTPNVVYILDNSTEAMGFDIHFLDSGGSCNFVSYSWGTSIPFEYAQGAAARILGIDFLTVYYLLSPALVAFLIPFALYYALSHFSERPTETAIGVLVTIGVVLLLGETHRTFGNFTLTRAYQGKTLLLAQGIPYFIGTTINYFKSPATFYWIILFATATGLVGATASTIPVLFALAIVLAIASSLSSIPEQHDGRYYLYYFLAFGYLALYAAFMVANSATELGIDSVVNQGYPTNFYGHLKFFINASIPATPIVVGLSSLTAIYFSSGKQRRMLIIWIVAAVLLFLNPLIAPIIIKYFSSPNIYWRLFYVYPFPLVIGISTVHIARQLRKRSAEVQIFAAALTFAILIGGHFLPSSSSVFQYRTDFPAPPEYKLPSQRVQVAQEIISRAPEGTMLAPPGLSGMIPMFSSRHPQVRIRENGALLWFGQCGVPEVARLRIEASEFVGGDSVRLPQFREFLNREGERIRSIVMLDEIIGFENVKEVLEAHRFVLQETVGDYVILWR